MSKLEKEQTLRLKNTLTYPSSIQALKVTYEQKKHPMNIEIDDTPELSRSSSPCEEPVHYSIRYRLNYTHFSTPSATSYGWIIDRVLNAMLKHISEHFFRCRGRSRTNRNSFSSQMTLRERILKKPLEALEHVRRENILPIVRRVLDR